ncbi:MAG: hypothetical protein ACOH2J_21305 [Allorhizobium sp.]
MVSRPFEHVRLGDRPLLVCDIDDVVLGFIAPFEAYLLSLGYRLIPRSFRLHGNIVSVQDGTPLEDQQVTRLILGFYDAQEAWQTPIPAAVASLRSLAESTDIVFLTAMPPAYAAQRRRLLDGFDLPYPMIASEQAKGPLVNALNDGRPLPVAFVDDMVRNLHSVGDSVADCLLVHLLPVSDIHRLAPSAGDHVHRARDWPEASLLIKSHIADAPVPPAQD